MPESSVSSQEDASGQILSVLAGWEPKEDRDVARYRTLADRSLEQVIHLTEYEDEKANRILTAIAFLSAFAGALFLAFVEHQPPSVIAGHPLTYSCAHRVAVLLAYVLMGLYGLLLVSGSAIVVGAIQPRFNTPRRWRTDKKEPPSFLFFEKILEASPNAWAEAFASAPGPTAMERKYLRNAVHESYLVAQKLSTKLRSLKSGLLLLRIGIWALGAWVLLAFATLLVFA